MRSSEFTGSFSSETASPMDNLIFRYMSGAMVTGLAGMTGSLLGSGLEVTMLVGRDST